MESISLLSLCETIDTLVHFPLTAALDICEDFLTFKGYTFSRLDGSTSVEDRWERIQQFSAAGRSGGQDSTDLGDDGSGVGNDDAFAFLLSTRAGGVGITLTAADRVIFLDNDWNPQMDLQAVARAHRIGQTKPVTVYRLVTPSTVESIMFQRSLRKLELSE